MDDLLEQQDVTALKSGDVIDAEVIEIKKQLASGLLPKQVADKLELSYYSIKDIHRGKTWKNINI